MKKRSKFNLSHTRQLSCDLGELVPIGCVEVMPGDRFDHTVQAMVRTQPLLAPLMHKIDVRVHHFFVPYRLIWDNWDDFITGGPTNTSTPAFPTKALLVGDVAVGSLADYLGIATGTAQTVSALPFRAYNRIWNEWFRDQDLETELTVSTADGVDATTPVALQTCAWGKDYFTTARPTEQKGTAISIPLAGQAPISGITLTTAAGAAANVANKLGVTAAQDDAASNPTWQSNTSLVNFKAQTTGAPNAATNRPQIFAELSAASGISVQSLRQFFALQRMAENRWMGSRFSEYLRYVFGVRSQDSRLDRSELLASGRDTIQFSEVMQTAADGTNPVGTLRGHGISASRGNGYRKTFPEHGIVMTLLSARPEAVYFQGTSRMWHKRTKEEYYQPELEHLGQQPITNKELWAAHASPDATFGFQERYAEYRQEFSRVNGEFRSLLKQWHLGRDFSASPALNAAFVKCVPNEANVFPTPAQDVLYIFALHDLRARRVLAPRSQYRII